MFSPGAVEVRKEMPEADQFRKEYFAYLENYLKELGGSRTKPLAVGDVVVTLDPAFEYRSLYITQQFPDGTFEVVRKEMPKIPVEIHFKQNELYSAHEFLEAERAASIKYPTTDREATAEQSFVQGAMADQKPKMWLH
ncbi:MAG: hypothetical protein Q7R83_01000 [bacterium]|nr:hypothetical protein [bacterium]